MDMSAKLLAIYGNECQIVSTLNERVPTLLRFTRLKSGVLVGFSTLPQQSGDVVALYQAKVQQSGRLWRFTRLTRRCVATVLCRYTWATSWKLQAGRKLRAASCELGAQFI